MKKVLIGCFACLVAFFGVLFSVGTSNTKLNLLVNNEVSRAASYVNNNFTIYLDNSVNKYELTTINIGITNTNSKTYYLDMNNNKNFLYDLSSFEEHNIKFTASLSENLIKIGNELVLALKNEGISPETPIVNDTWYAVVPNNDFTDYTFVAIKGLIIENITLNDNINEINSYLEPFIGDYLPDVIDPDLPPSSPSDNPLNDISYTINGVLDWFVDLFNGLSDIFIVSDINGNFLGFSLWGNILFIEVSVGLVIIVLRWVISLIKGI